MATVTGAFTASSVVVWWPWECDLTVTLEGETPVELGVLCDGYLMGTYGVPGPELGHQPFHLRIVDSLGAVLVDHEVGGSYFWTELTGTGPYAVTVTGVATSELDVLDVGHTNQVVYWWLRYSDTGDMITSDYTVPGIDVVLGDPPPPPTDTSAGSSLELYLLDGDTPAWVDLVANDLGVSDTYTCSRTCSLQGPYVRQSPGQLRFSLDNGATAEADAGQWSPENPASPWRVDGRTLLRQGLPARVSITPPHGDPVLIWGGRVTEWPPDYSLGDLWSTVDVEAIDAVDRLQAANLPALQQPVGAGENAADRIQRVLDRIDYEPVSILDSATYCTMQGTTLERAAWDEITLTADSDGGYVFVDVHGQVHYLARDFHIGLAPAVVFSTLSDGADFDETDLRFSDPQSTNDTNQEFNVIKFSPAGGIEQAAQASDMDPADFYGIRSYERSDLICESNRQAMDLALFTIGLTRTADFRFSRIQVDLFPQTDAAIWTKVIGLELLDKLRVKLKAPSSDEFGRVIIRDHLIVGLSWTINDRESVWQCVIDLAQAPPDYPLMEFDGTGDDATLDMDGLVASWL